MNLNCALRVHLGFLRTSALILATHCAVALCASARRCEVKKKAVFNGYDNTVWFHFREMEFPENQTKRERLPVNKFYASPAMFNFLINALLH